MAYNSSIAKTAMSMATMRHRRDFLGQVVAVGASAGLIAAALPLTDASAQDASPSSTDTVEQSEQEEGTEMVSAADHYTLADDAAEAIWFTGCLALIKGVGSRTGDSLATVEFIHPEGYATLLHIHHTADEAFYVLSGAMQGVCGDRAWSATTGSFVFLPRGVPHGYVVDGDETLRTLAITVPAGFDRFVVEAGEPAQERALPPAGPPDIAKLEAAGAKYEIEIVGPPIELRTTPTT